MTTSAEDARRLLFGDLNELAPPPKPVEGFTPQGSDILGALVARNRAPQSAAVPAAAVDPTLTNMVGSATDPRTLEALGTLNQPREVAAPPPPPPAPAPNPEDVFAALPFVRTINAIPSNSAYTDLMKVHIIDLYKAQLDAETRLGSDPDAQKAVTAYSAQIATALDDLRTGIKGSGGVGGAGVAASIAAAERRWEFEQTLPLEQRKVEMMQAAEDRAQAGQEIGQQNLEQQRQDKAREQQQAFYKNFMDQMLAGAGNYLPAGQSTYAGTNISGPNVPSAELLMQAFGGRIPTGVFPPGPTLPPRNPILPLLAGQE